MHAGYTLCDIVAPHAFASAGRGRIALVAEGVARSYGELNERALRFASALRALGVAPGDRVAVLMGNGHAWPETLFAVSALGAVCVPVNVLLNGREVAHVLSDSGATTLVADRVAQRALGELPALPERLIRVGRFEPPEAGRWHDFEALLGRAQTFVPGSGSRSGSASDRPRPQDPAMIYYTSGTTGLPKGAVHSHSGVLWNGYHQIADVGLSRDDVYLLVPSLSWSAGFHDVMLALMWIGGRTAMLPTGGTTIERIVDAVEAEHATHVLLVPTLLKVLIATPGAIDRLRRTRLRRILTGGEMVPPSVIETLNEALPACRVTQIYGMSEFPLMMTVMGSEDSLAYPERTGKASSIVTLGIRHADGTISDTGSGEVLVRSPATMLGYHGQTEATAEALAGGWFRTGDTGVLDDEGYLTLTGRAKDMIISGGMNVYPREIENLIHGVEGVREVAVVGVADARWGEVPVAIVVGDEAAAIERAVQGACAQLSSYKRPKQVIVRREPLPRTPTGKVLKRELRPWALEQAITRGPSDESN